MTTGIHVVLVDEPASLRRGERIVKAGGQVLRWKTATTGRGYWAENRSEPRPAVAERKPTYQYDAHSQEK
jgi:hypothetical protein